MLGGKNNYIQNKGLWTVFTASVLISVVSQMNSMIDGVIVSHLISSDAISAVSLVGPVTMLLNLVLGVLCVGACIVATKELGKQNYDNVKRIFSVCLLTALVSNVVLVVCLLPFTDDIAKLLTSDARLLPFVAPYLKWSVIGCIGIIMQVLLSTFVKITGKPKLVTYVSMAEFTSNILLDLIFVGVCGLGIMGAALATALSGIISCMIMLPTIMAKDSLLKLVIPRGEWFFSWLKDVLLNGLPSTIGSVAMAVLYFLMNTLIQKAQGADGMFILTVGMQILMISSLVLGGAGEAVVNIGGVLLGEEDISEYRRLVTGIIKKVSVAIILVTAILMVCPDFLAKLFGATERLQDVARQPLRLICLALLPMGITSIQDISFQLLGHKTLSTVMSIQTLIIILPSLWLSTMFCPQYVWHSLSFGLWAELFVMVCCTFILSRRDKILHWFTLIPVLPNYVNISFSIPYNIESLDKALEDTRLFIKTCDLPQDISTKVYSSIEKLTTNLLPKSDEAKKQGYFDLRVVDTGVKIIVAIKSVGSSSLPDDNITLCDDVKYKYLNGINCTYLNFPYKF